MHRRCCNFIGFHKGYVKLINGEEQSIVLAIDAGTTQTGFCFVDEATLEPIQFGKINNDKVYDEIHRLSNLVNSKCKYRIAIEQFAHYGSKHPMGATTIEAITWNGKFIREAEQLGIPYEYVYRKEEKMLILGTMKGGDTEIRHALIQRFAKTENGKGTKDDPDYFYGFANDVWAAYCVALVAIMRARGITKAKDWT